MSEPTNWTKVGTKTSEFITTIVGMATGFLTILAAFYEFLQTVHEAYPTAGWLSAVMAFIGGLITIGSTLGFTKSRAVVKAAMGQVDAAAITAGQPLVFAKPAATVTPLTAASTARP